MNTEAQKTLKIAQYIVGAISAYSIVQTAIISPLHNLLTQVEILKVDVTSLKQSIAVDCDRGEFFDDKNQMP